LKKTAEITAQNKRAAAGCSNRREKKKARKVKGPLTKKSSEKGHAESKDEGENTAGQSACGWLKVAKPHEDIKKPNKKRESFRV